MSAVEQPAPPSAISPEELTQLVRHENLLRDLLTDWERIIDKGNDPEAVAVFSDKMDAAVKMVRGDPVPSPEFRDFSTRKRAWTLEECQTMVNGALLVLVSKTPGDRLRITTDQIFAAHARLGSLALALSDDDKLLTITGLKVS